MRVRFVRRAEWSPFIRVISILLNPPVYDRGPSCTGSIQHPRYCDDVAPKNTISLQETQFYVL